jgi:two-component system response regulator YesN
MGRQEKVLKGGTDMFQMLLVDDEASVVDSLADTIPWHTVGIDHVFKAYSGIEALEILKTNSIDIMISDIRMPEMNGLQLLARVRSHWRKLKFILLSGHAEFVYAQEAISHELFGYLLKPVSDADVISKVSDAVEALRKERAENLSKERVAKAFQESLPKLKGELLNELLQGYKFLPGRLGERMESLKITVADSDRFALMLVRLENKLSELDFYSQSLMEYAIGNIAEELFEDWFELWCCRDVHGYLAFMVTVNKIKRAELVLAEHSLEEISNLLELAASQLQLSVERYLKGTVSVLIGRWGIFPGDVRTLYDECLLAFRKRVGNQSGLFISASKEPEQALVHSLHRLYEPPLLVHLLESGNWEAAFDKLTGIWNELNQKWSDSNEQMIEVFFSIYASFSSFAHKNGRELAEMVGPELTNVAGLTPCRSNAALKNWIFQTYGLLRQCMENETRNDREAAIHKIQLFVQKYLVEDVSLQAIADHMFMHPVHVSRLYKLETGENLSDFVLRLKMELAASMLANPSLKIYEIALQLGYQKPNYFIKVFKKYYSLTPQEFRQKLEHGE